MRELHDAVAVAVHPERRDEMAAGIDHGDGMALVAAGGMGDAAGDDRLRRARIQPRRRLLRRGGGAEQQRGDNEIFHHALP